MDAQTPLGGAPPFETISAASGVRLGRFQVLGHFASGGTSELWVALKDGAHEICLLKQLSTELGQHEMAHKRLVREAQIAFRLDHPNIGRVLTAGFEAGRFCLSTEFIPGQSLAAIMGKLVDSGAKAMPPSIVLAIAVAVLDGLTYLHDLTDEDGKPFELVHRDLTPGNVVVTFDGHVKIIDFGTARARIDQFRTAPGVVLGTPEYMSPEQAMADPLDRRSDLYTLGVVLHELLTGHEFVPRSHNILEVLEAVRKAAPRPVSQLNPVLPRALDPVIARAMAKTPAARFRDAPELKAALLAAAAPLEPAKKSEVSRFIRALMPAEEARIEDLLSRGRQLAEITAEHVTEDSLAQSMFTRADLMVPTTATEVVPRPSRFHSEETAPTAVLARATTGARARRRSTAGETPAVLEMPGTAAVNVSSSQLLKEAAALRRSVRLWRVAFIATAVCAALVVALFTLRNPAPVAVAPEPAPAPVPSAAAPVHAEPAAEPAPIARPAAEPAPAAAAAPRPEPASKRARPRPQKTREAAPAPPPAEAEAAAVAEPAPPPPKPQDPLAAMLKQLQSDPKDLALFDRLEAAIRARAQHVPADKRRLIVSDLDAAGRTYDVSLLADALRKLNRP